MSIESHTRVTDAEQIRVSPPVWNTTNCEREPIRIPGAIQGHGFLIAVDSKTFEITTVSENVRSFLSITYQDLLGQTLSGLLPDATRAAWMDIVGAENLAPKNPFVTYLITPDGEKRFDTMAYRLENKIVFEFEPAGVEQTFTSRFYYDSRTSISALRSSRTLEELFVNAVSEIRKITGFDRVIIYRFDDAWNGTVLAEEKGRKGDSYLHLHFPASDIPAQARELYKLNRIRVIPDTQYKPSPLVSRGSSDFIIGDSLDLSQSALRSVSPVHIEYLKNMEATASMSVSLLYEGRLWGLISCTHLSGPQPVSFEARAVCDLVGEVMSSLLPIRMTENFEATATRVNDDQTKLLEAMAREDDFVSGLVKDPVPFLDLVNAKGGAVYSDGNFHLVGETPEVDQIRSIINWISEQPPTDLHCSDSLPSEFAGAEAFRNRAAGVLGFNISRAQATYVIWFRPEVVQTVSWGGNPNKPVTHKPEGQGEAANATDGVVLHPRKSFEAWKETVRGRCLPWQSFEKDAALKLRASIIDVVLLRLERIALLNQELKRSNDELDSFAYAASHDLKEPLRGIHNYATILSRALAPTLTGDNKERLATIGRLSQRMEDLINSLLSYSQIGRAELYMKENDPNEVVRAALDSLRTRIDETKTTIRCKFDLPRATFDRVQVLEIFTNLISNAIKYNDSPEKVVEIGWELRNRQPCMYVRDNGIGIEEENRESVFKIFKRLHARDKYGGGTGTGLTITAKIVERHGGRIWIDSSLGQGTTFYFTLSGFKVEVRG